VTPKDIVTSGSLPPPIGPYSHGVVATGSRLVFVAGQIAWDETGRIVGKGSIAEQYRRILEIIAAVVSEAGGSMADVCKLVHYVARPTAADDPEYRQLAEIRREFVERDFPVSTMVEVAGLMDRDALIEVDAIAVLE
jgi:enamine deaminase RidA (YjgF/YER057c/UK114 family)